eukprot:5943893-Pyramimonas_sp.AAC.2
MIEKINRLHTCMNCSRLMNHTSYCSGCGCCSVGCRQVCEVQSEPFQTFARVISKPGARSQKKKSLKRKVAVLEEEAAAVDDNATTTTVAINQMTHFLTNPI